MSDQLTGTAGSRQQRRGVSDESHDFVRAFLAGDGPAMLERLAPDAAFHSPAADYHDHEAIGAVFGALAQVIDAPRVTRTIAHEDETVVFFTTDVDGRRGDGMLRVVARADGRATDVTLMVRPLAALLAGIEQMKALLSVPR